LTITVGRAGQTSKEKRRCKVEREAMARALPREPEKRKNKGKKFDIKKARNRQILSIAE